MDILLSQCNPTVADAKGNCNLLLTCINEAAQANVDVAVFSENFTVGYPARDYLYSQSLWDNQKVIADRVLQTLRSMSRQMTVIYGGLHSVELSYGRTSRFNAAFIIDPILGIRVVHKQLLPRYDIFDETRYFTPGDRESFPISIHVEGKNGMYTEDCDVLICEDIWNFRNVGNVSRMAPCPYAYDPVSELKGTGPLFVVNASPFWQGKPVRTRKLVEDIALGINRPVVWVNQVGGQDDIIFGGYSMVSVPYEPNVGQRRLMTRIARPFAEDRMIVRLEDRQTKMSYLFPREAGSPIDNERLLGFQMPTLYGQKILDSDFDLWTIRESMVLGLRDYARRTGFKKAVLGLSGGIDSAIVAELACDALGPENVSCWGLPSQYSSSGSISDSEQLCKALGCSFGIIPIADVHKAIRAQLLSGGQQEFNYSLTDENIQPRIRMIFLRAKSSETGALLLTTGNKSEISVGYCTLEGDMAGGFALISDVYKTMVYDICKMTNRYKQIYPEAILTKAPSAELREGQQDTDSLPPYETLDPILYEMIENELCPEEVILKLGDKFAPHVPRVFDLYRKSEYKRRVLPAGPKVMPRSYGSGRRVPIACRFSLA